MINEEIREHLSDLLIYARQPHVEMTLRPESHEVTIVLLEVDDTDLATLDEMVKDAQREHSL